MEGRERFPLYVNEQAGRKKGDWPYSREHGRKIASIHSFFKSKNICWEGVTGFLSILQFSFFFFSSSCSPLKVSVEVQAAMKQSQQELYFSHLPAVGSLGTGTDTQQSCGPHVEIHCSGSKKLNLLIVGVNNTTSYPVPTIHPSMSHIRLQKNTHQATTGLFCVWIQDQNNTWSKIHHFLQELSQMPDYHN